MTQSTDLAAIANQQAAFYRARVNANFKSVVTQHYGASEPPVVYENMLWFSSGDGYIKLRSPTNTSWQNIGTIGPPLKWTTSVDLPQNEYVTGDIKASYNPTQPAGWQHLNDGSIGNISSGATSRVNPDAWPLFNLLWLITSDDWCHMYAAGTWTRTGRGASSASDWAAQRHIILPKMVGRVPAAAGWGAGLSSFGLATWAGAETVALDGNSLPSHYHAVGDHSHYLPPHGHRYRVYTGDQSSWGSQGAGAFPTCAGGVVAGPWGGEPVDNNDGAVIGAGGDMWITGGGTTTGYAGSGSPHSNIQPTTYVYYFIRL